MCITQHRNNPRSFSYVSYALWVISWNHLHGDVWIAYWDALVPAVFFYCTDVAWELARSPSPPNQLFSSSSSFIEVVLLLVSCTDSLYHAAGLLLVNVNNKILRTTSSVFCDVIKYCKHCHHLGDWVITYLRQWRIIQHTFAYNSHKVNFLPFVLLCGPKQEVLLHHPPEGPGVSIPQRVATCAARRNVENLTAHVWRANPDARRAALLLRGLRLVGMHPAAVHGLSLQPGQQQTGREEEETAPEATARGSKTCVCRRTLFVAGSSHGFGAANWRECSQEGKVQINPQPILLFLWIYLTANILKNCWFQTRYCYWSPLVRSPASDCTFGIINTGPLEKIRLVVSKGIYLVNGSMPL